MIKKIQLNDILIETWDIYILQEAIYTGWNVKELNTFNKPYWVGLWYSSYNTRNKILRVSWIIKNDTIWGLNFYIDNFLSKIDWQMLDIYIHRDDVIGDNQILYSTWYIINDNLIERWPQDLTFCKFTLEINILEWYFEWSKYIEETLNVAIGWSTLPYQLIFNNEWSDIIYPILLINATSTITTDIYVWDIEGRKITISEDLVDWDVLTVDCQDKTVRKNGDLIDYAGIFPRYNPWSQVVVTNFDWIVIKYKPRYK